MAGMETRTIVSIPVTHTSHSHNLRLTHLRLKSKMVTCHMG